LEFSENNLGCSLSADPYVVNVYTPEKHPEILAGIGVRYGKGLSAYKEVYVLAIAAKINDLG